MSRLTAWAVGVLTPITLIILGQQHLFPLVGFCALGITFFYGVTCWLAKLDQDDFEEAFDAARLIVVYGYPQDLCEEHVDEAAETVMASVEYRAELLRSAYDRGRELGLHGVAEALFRAQQTLARWDDPYDL